jgi:hypothetical protein
VDVHFIDALTSLSTVGWAVFKSTFQLFPSRNAWVVSEFNEFSSFYVKTEKFYDRCRPTFKVQPLIV